jgi:phosphinothricin acetyltransferase
VAAQAAGALAGAFGLASVIGGCARHRPSAVPFAVGAYLAAAYWFTVSTSFANPAVTLAWSVSDTFAGIRRRRRPGLRGRAGPGRDRGHSDDALARPARPAMTPPSSPVVRLASPADAAAIARIYNEGLEERNATFETAPRTPRDVEAQLEERGDRYPTVVVEREGQVVAWASAGPYRARLAYAGVAEHSVYVARAARGTGAGRAALEALCRAYAERGFWKIVSRIFPENTASLALHERCGFRVVGVYRRHGRLDGRWRDCVIVEKLLGDAARA